MIVPTQEERGDRTGEELDLPHKVESFKVARHQLGERVQHLDAAPQDGVDGLTRGQLGLTDRQDKVGRDSSSGRGGLADLGTTGADRQTGQSRQRQLLRTGWTG